MAKTKIFQDIKSKDKIEILLSIASIALSIVAIYISLSVAENQNRISLFEKRFEVYQVFKSLTSNSVSAHNTLDEQIWPLFDDITDEATENAQCFDVYVNLLDFLGLDIDVNYDLLPEDQYVIVVAAANEYCIKLDSAKYLFDLSENEKEQIDQLIEEFRNFTSSNYIFYSGEEKFKENVLNLLNKIDQVDLLFKMEQELLI